VLAGHEHIPRDSVAHLGRRADGDRIQIRHFEKVAVVAEGVRHTFKPDPTLARGRYKLEIFIGVDRWNVLVMGNFAKSDDSYLMRHALSLLEPS